MLYPCFALVLSLFLSLGEGRSNTQNPLSETSLLAGILNLINSYFELDHSSIIPYFLYTTYTLSFVLVYDAVKTTFGNEYTQHYVFKNITPIKNLYFSIIIFIAQNICIFPYTLASQTGPDLIKHNIISYFSIFRYFSYSEIRTYLTQHSNTSIVQITIFLITPHVMTLLWTQTPLLGTRINVTRKPKDDIKRT